MNNSINILLLEDNLYDVELVKHQVIKSGIKFKWLHVSDWDGFVEAINSFKPDIILSDYNLGGFTGLDALEFAKRNCPLIPFIIVTGTLNEETAADTIKKGAWDYVVKERLLRLNTAIKNALVLKVEKERLQQSYNFNSFLLKTIPFGMDIVDESGTVLFQSDNFKELCGEMGIGKKCWELYKDDKAQCSGCPLNKGINIGETDVYESHNLLGGRVFEISHTGMMFKGKKALLKIFQDITKRKENEKELLIAKNQAEESDKLKTAFLHNISHEVRTPLNAIVGFSGLLNDHLMTPEKRKEFTDIIIQSSDQLLSIIDDIFSIAAIEAGQEKIVENEVNINLIAKLLKKTTIRQKLEQKCYS